MQIKLLDGEISAVGSREVRGLVDKNVTLSGHVNPAVNLMMMMNDKTQFNTLHKKCATEI